MAILVVLIIISVLAFFLSSLDPENTIPDSCILGDGFNSENHVVNNAVSTAYTVGMNNVTLLIRNQKGVPVTITEVVVTEPTLGRCKTATAPGALANGAFATVIVNTRTTAGTVPAANDCDLHKLSVGSKIKGDVTITWYATNSGTAFTKTAKGTFVTNVN